jgi:hypothetical protein
MKITAILTALAAYTASVEAFFILTHPILEVTRLDPIINPGTVSSQYVLDPMAGRYFAIED